MNLIILGIITLVVMVALAAGAKLLLEARRKNLVTGVNIAEGTHQDGCITRLSSAAITTRFLIGKRGADDAHIAVCSAVTDLPQGIITDEADAAEEPINVATFGGAASTRKVALGGTVAVGDRLTTTAAGKAVVLPAAAATYNVFGRALQAGVDGDVIEFDPTVPYPVVVT